jgi:hypothetical protein
VSITAHQTISGKISPFSNPLDITCHFTVNPPTVNFPADTVYGTASTDCRYDRDNSPAQVASIDMVANLFLNGFRMDRQDEPKDETNFSGTAVFSTPCNGGTWSHDVTLVVVWPKNQGYDPPSSQAETSLDSSIVNCPGDGGGGGGCACTGSSVGGAEPAVRRRFAGAVCC